MTNEYGPGDGVFHTYYGYGAVLEVEHTDDGDLTRLRVGFGSLTRYVGRTEARAHLDHVTDMAAWNTA